MKINYVHHNIKQLSVIPIQERKKDVCVKIKEFTLVTLNKKMTMVKLKVLDVVRIMVNVKKKKVIDAEVILYLRLVP